MGDEAVNRAVAEELLRALVAIPSLSGAEREASYFLQGRMRTFGYDRAYVDAAGNAVGEMGPEDAAHTVVLLGHIDTVPGNIPVRIEPTEEGPVLYGRGSVDAKGPLATFTAAVGRLGQDWAAAHNVRLIVVGAVEEEAATSKGARFLRHRFDGATEPTPDYCIIGEPSGWQRVTLGYKGRLLLEMEAGQPMAHTAGPDPGMAVLAVDLWNWTAAYAARFNAGRAHVFDQLLPSLRGLRTWTDDSMQDRVWTKIGLRLPLNFAADALLAELWAWLRERTGSAGSLPQPPFVEGQDAAPATFTFPGARTTVTVHTRGYEPAWRSGRNSPLVRSFLAAIRRVGAVRPGFVVKSGTSDMNVVGPAWGCPILAYGPGDSHLDHTPHEHIRLDEYWRAITVLEEALRTLVGQMR